MAAVIDGSGNAVSRALITSKPPISADNRASSPNGRRNSAVGGFDSILRQKQAENEEIRFSKHAELRLQSRNISLTQAQKDKMKEAVARAESKGVRDSLVLMDNLAFVVNVRNKTVITAANSNELKENVFTNIDGAVIV